MDYKCKLIITIGDDDDLSINLDNPGKVSPLTLSGALDLVKFGLHSSMSHGIVESNKENLDASNSIAGG